MERKKIKSAIKENKNKKDASEVKKVLI